MGGGSVIHRTLAAQGFGLVALDVVAAAAVVANEDIVVATAVFCVERTRVFVGWFGVFGNDVPRVDQAGELDKKRYVS